MPKSHLAAATALAAGGVVTRQQLSAGNVDDDLPDRLVRTGAWRRLAPSTYLARPGLPTDAELVEAARAHAGQAAVITGLVACRALGMPDVPPARVVEVLIGPGTRVVSTPYITVHQSERMPATWIRGGASYAMPARAVVDGARACADLRTARALVLGAVCRGFSSAAELSAEVESGPRRGSAIARRAVDDALAGAWSAPEAEAAGHAERLVQRRVLPPFLLNPTLYVGGQRLSQPDGWIVGAGVGWQVESRRHHGGEADFDATLAVHDDYARHGLTLLHVTPRRLRHLGPAWAQTLVAAVAARERAGQAEPGGLVVVQYAPLQTGARRRPLTPPPPR